MPAASNVDWNKTTTILDTLSISYINYHLPREHQSIWRLLYSNSLHGDSFAQLTRYVLGKGPNVLLVKDKDGHVFGAYVSDSWEIKPTFYGKLFLNFIRLNICKFFIYLEVKVVYV
jgi:hypothetical protein